MDDTMHKPVHQMKHAHLQGYWLLKPMLHIQLIRCKANRHQHLWTFNAL